MSAVLLHDSSRSGALTWAADLITNGIAAGMILNPFSTPRRTISRAGTTPAKTGATESRHRLADAGGEVFFDPTSHGALATGANLFNLYDTWELWPPGSRGTTTDAALTEHVDRVLARCDEISLRPIAPTLPLTSPTSPAATSALRMAELAVEADVGAYVAIVGTSTFWAAGSALDAYIGELVQLRPAGWAVTVTRDALRYPWPGLDPAEVAGLCRTVHSLSLRDAEVIACHGDLAALPAVAAGATYVGSGWDLRHRSCADDIFRSSSGIRRASYRVAHRGLLATLKRVEAETIHAADPTLSARLVPGPLPPDYNAHWRHHLRVLNSGVNRVASAGAGQARVDTLRRMYRTAQRDFDAVIGIVSRLEAGRSQWIDPLADGLELYAQGEGW